ncbi:hypothetical protein JCM11491_002714 [Sporobolomyces phaffii]
MSTRYTSATAFLEHASTADVLTYTVPTAGPIDEQAPVPVLNQADHALYSATWFPPYPTAPSGFVLARVIEDAFTLELRWVSFTRPPPPPPPDDDDDGRENPFRELDAHPGTLAPVRFTFPSRLVPTPSLTLATNDDDAPVLEVMALSEAGYVYALAFPLDSLFYGLDDSPAAAGSEWSEEFKVEGLEGRTPVLMHGADEGRIVIACSDGHSLVAEIAQGSDGALIETELRTPSSFSIRSLVPSFSRRDLSSSSSTAAAAAAASPLRLVSGSAHSTASPSQIVSLAVATPSRRALSESAASTFGFGVSRDRKLKVWNLETGACLRSIDLPKPSARSSSSVVLPSPSSQVDNAAAIVPLHPKTQLLLPPTPQPFVKITTVASAAGGSYGAYLTLFVPANAGAAAAFFVYGLALDPATGELSELLPVAERAFGGSGSAAAAARVVDFDVKKMALDGRERWTLWTVSESGGEADLGVCRLSELDADEDDDDDDHEDEDEDEWKFVSRGASTTAEWTAAYFDAEMEAAPSGVTVTEVFLGHVSVPGRYPPASFDYALDVYEDIARAECADRGVCVPRAFELEYESNLVRAAAVVGSGVEVEHSSQTGAALVDVYTKRVKLEWLRFVALLNESRKAALFPTALAVDEPTGLAFVVARDSVSVPVEQAVVESLHAHLDLPALVGPMIAPGSPGSNFVALVGVVARVRSQLSLAARRSFEQAVLDRVRTPFTTDVADVALDLFEQTLEPVLSDSALAEVLAAVRAFDAEPGPTIERFLSDVVLATDPPARRVSIPCLPDAHRWASELGTAVVADVVTTTTQARYDLALAVVLVLVAAWGAAAATSDAAGAEPAIAGVEQTTGCAFAALHAVAALEWTATQVAYPTLDAVERVVHSSSSSSASGGDEVAQQFQALRVVGAEVLPVPTYSLVNALLRIPTYAPRVPAATYAALPAALSDAAQAFVAATGLVVSTPSTIIDATAADVRFAHALVELGQYDQALAFVGQYPTAPGFAYVRARAELARGDARAATTGFERAASGWCAPASAPGGSGGLREILPEDVSSLAKYYVHVVELCVPTPFDETVARFAQLALDALDDDDDNDEAEVDEAVAKDLWTKLFRAWAAVGEYDRAYRAIMDTPFHDTQTQCLAHLISLVCERGASSVLTTRSFAGLEADLERNLAFRARNSDPLATPDYYKVLYAYHVSRGDYRSAGTVMYQQARRIGDKTARGGSFRDLATVQCQSYLAAANALSLVAREHAWVAVVAAAADSDASATKRRKVTYHIPDDEYDPDSGRPLEVRQLADIRREYAVALARLQLSAEFPELERTNFHLEPEAVVALFSQTHQFDHAFTAARTLDVDLSSLFEILAEKCVGLTVHPEGTDDASWVALSPEAATWEEEGGGSVASKAWRLLARHLERHDHAPAYRYRLVVLDRVLATQHGAAQGKLPAFLTEFLVKHRPDALLATLVRFDRLDDAFRYSLETIKNSSIPSSSSSSQEGFGTTLPYSIFDQLVAIPAPSSSSSSSVVGGLSADVLKQRQDELREAVRDRLRRVRTLDDALALKR